LYLWGTHTNFSYHDASNIPVVDTVREARTSFFNDINSTLILWFYKIFLWKPLYISISNSDERLLIKYYDIRRNSNCENTIPSVQIYGGVIEHVLLMCVSWTLILLLWSYHPAELVKFHSFSSSFLLHLFIHIVHS
jgi:hypothetical protein